MPFDLQHGPGWDRTWVSAVVERRPSFWAMAWSQVGNVWDRILSAQFKFGWVVRCASTAVENLCWNRTGVSAVNSLFRNCTKPLFYVFALMPLANLHHFLICNPLVFSLAPFGWFICIYWSSLLMWISFFIYAHFFRNVNRAYIRSRGYVKLLLLHTRPRNPTNSSSMMWYVGTIVPSVVCVSKYGFRVTTICWRVCGEDCNCTLHTCTYEWRRRKKVTLWPWKWTFK